MDGFQSAALARWSVIVILAEVVGRGWHQRGVDELPAAVDDALLDQLRRHVIEQRLGIRRMNASLEVLDVDRVRVLLCLPLGVCKGGWW